MAACAALACTTMAAADRTKDKRRAVFIGSSRMCLNILDILGKKWHPWKPTAAANLKERVRHLASYTLGYHFGKRGNGGRGICADRGGHDRAVRDKQIFISKNLPERFAVSAGHTARRSIGKLHAPSA